MPGWRHAGGLGGVGIDPECAFRADAGRGTHDRQCALFLVRWRAGHPEQGGAAVFRVQHQYRAGALVLVEQAGAPAAALHAAGLPAADAQVAREFQYLKGKKIAVSRNTVIDFCTDLALEKAGLSAEDVWYIGDQYEADIVGAGNAGLHSVWYQGAIDMDFEKRDDVFTIESWDELKIMMEENR